MNGEEGLVSRKSGGGGEWPTVCTKRTANDGHPRVEKLLPPGKDWPPARLHRVAG